MCTERYNTDGMKLNILVHKLFCLVYKFPMCIRLLDSHECNIQQQREVNNIQNQFKKRKRTTKNSANKTESAEHTLAHRLR